MSFRGFRHHKNQEFMGIACFSMWNFMGCSNFSAQIAIPKSTVNVSSPSWFCLAQPGSDHESTQLQLQIHTWPGKITGSSDLTMRFWSAWASSAHLGGNRSATVLDNRRIATSTPPPENQHFDAILTQFLTDHLEIYSIYIYMAVYNIYIYIFIYLFIYIIIHVSYI